jgi:hypothetical protein
MINKTFTKWPFYLKLRLFFGVFLLIIIAVFLYLKIVPFGHIVYSRSWPESAMASKGFIDDFHPGIRVDNNETNFLKIVSEPVYFSLFTSRGFDKAKLTIKYENKLSSNTPVFAVGLLRDKVTETYDLKTLGDTTIPGENKKGTASFDLLNAPFTDGHYSFLFSIPGLNQDGDYLRPNSYQYYLGIKEIKVELTGKTLWEKISEKIKTF